MKKILFIVLLAITSCSSDNEIKPVDIHYGEDMCERCKMIISEERFSSQIILNNGQVYNFDDIGGMILYITENKINTENSKIYVKDFKTKEWLDSDDAFYIRMEKIKTPMDYGIIAVSDKESIEETISKSDNKFIGKFDDAMKWISK